ncbi:MAG: hypothetical protein NT007_13840 [Candidatus Kapabacteria bacterium]|nr:hypothetical protein [Candidatus Kapabacteria bacterium]
MITNPDVLKKFELELEQKINNSYSDKLRIYESMAILRNEISPAASLLDGLDEKIEFVRRLHQTDKKTKIKLKV